MIIKIISLSLAWFFVGFLITIFTSSPSKGHLNKDRKYDYDDEVYYRFVFSVVLWPVALIIRIVKFIIGLLYILWIGFKEELKNK